MPEPDIRYLKRSEIDVDKWDACIRMTSNCLIYGYSFYLDEMATNWDGLVFADYQAVMPLTWNSKYGVRYLYQPAFTQQLGIFYRDASSTYIFKLFINELNKHFRFAEICLNYQNKIQETEERPNIILDLSNDYESIRSNYKSDLQKNLVKSQKALLQYSSDIDLIAAQKLFKELNQEKMGITNHDSFNRFERLCSKNNFTVLRCLRNDAGLIVAVALLFLWEKRLYLMQSTVTNEGRKLSANHRLLDSVIKEFSGRELIFDFEGSLRPGIRHFYENFGSQNQPYYFMRFNNLPVPLKWLKS